MISYLVLTGSPEAVKSGFSKARMSFEESLTFVPKEVVYKISANGQWAVCAAGAVEDAISSRIILDNRGVFCIAGPYSSAGMNVQDIFEALLKEGPSKIFEIISGGYNVASLSLRQRLVSFSDFSGCYPVYNLDSDGDLRMVSNSPLAIKNIVDSKPESQSVSWLLGHANIFMDRYVFQGVDRVTPGKIYRTNIGPYEGAELFDASPGFWPEKSSREYFSSDSVDWKSHLDKLSQSFLEYYKAFPDLKISLTGGKDSRLILACALNAGLRSEIETFTKGPVGSPEIECAENLARQVGVSHSKVHTSPQETKKSWDSDGIWKTIKMSVFRYGGGVCLWDGRASNVNGLSFDITGFGGELYRGPGGHAKQFKSLEFLDDDDLLKYWVNYHQLHDPLGLLKPEYKEFQRSELSRWLQDNKNIRSDILPEKFFVENRLSHWNGPLAQQVTGRVKLMPLLNSSLARDVFSLSPGLRNAEIAHYELMSEVSIGLANSPFLNDSWSKEIIELKGLEPVRAFSPKGFSPRKVQSWQWDFVELEKGNIKNLFERAYSATMISDFVDMEKAIKLISHYDFKSVIEVKEVISLVGICVLFLGELLPCYDKVS